MHRSPSPARFALRPLLSRLALASALAAAALPFAGTAGAAEEEERHEIAIAIHGGAGALAPGRYTEEEEAAYHDALAEALRRGYAVLDEGGTSVDAVVAAIAFMEDSPLFNAGKGAVFTAEGANELDASIMRGEDRNAGAVAGVTRIKNPILAARAVMEKSEHVMFSGPGAVTFAEAEGLETVEPEYFYTERSWERLERARERASQRGSLPEAFKYGTVGAVALDREGNLAAGTSTGGMTFKKHGRIGDSPIIGAGTYADNAACAVSATGHGEYFIRIGVTRTICLLMEREGMTGEEAAEAVIMGDLAEMGGTGGVVLMDPQGRPAFVFNTKGMFRGALTPDLPDPMTAIYGEGD